jgi:hypothetical protein
VSRRKLGVIRGRVGAADLELDPQAPGSIRPLKHDIGTGVISEESAVSRVEERPFRGALPATRAARQELLLEVACEATELGLLGSGARLRRNG